MLRFTIQVIRKCRRLNIPVSVENPNSSRLWSMPCFRAEARHARRCVADYCAFGTSWRKRTCFAVFGAPALLCLNDHRCKFIDGKCMYSRQPHVVLSGKHASGVALTKVAESYPRSLCRLIARSIDDYFDVRGRRCLSIHAPSSCSPVLQLWLL